MIIITMILTIMATIVCRIMNENGNDGWCVTSGAGAVIFGIIDLILIGFVIIGGINMITVDQKIDMFQEENTKIEEQITTIVNSYKGYEKETISNIAEMEVLMIKFPELKTSDLVKTQMNVYIENNKKIKQLKEIKIETKITKWLLYFGG